MLISTHEQFYIYPGVVALFNWRAIELWAHQKRMVSLSQLGAAKVVQYLLPL
jgi:hypothetical protein